MPNSQSGYHTREGQQPLKIRESTYVIGPIGFDERGSINMPSLPSTPNLEIWETFFPRPSGRLGSLYRLRC